jgi:hypothetical protein
MNDTHTPGPWTAGEGLGNADGSRRWEVSACAGPLFGDDTEIIVVAEHVSAANARLIAAAPELLAAAKLALAHLRCEYADPVQVAAHDALVKAVAQAEGRP